MSYNITLYIALAIFAGGLIYKIANWFRYRPGAGAVDIAASARVSAAVRGILSSILSRKILILVRVFILDVLFQARIFRQDLLRWVIHICIFGGFMLLLLMHALGNITISPLFTEYYSTLNPFMFLRNLFGAIVVLGLALALYRRFVLRVPRLATNGGDISAIVILAIIMISGLFLEGTKIASYSRYQEMVKDYADIESKDQSTSLESFWINAFGVASPHLKGPFDEKTLKAGEEIHEMSCAGCHSRPQWAFLGYGIARAMKPAALFLDRANIHTFLWYLHFIACSVGLAYLPFSKFFHVIASPLSLLANAVMEKGKSDEANLATKEAIELDACTHCGACSLRCSAAVFFEEIPNANILPSEKMASLRALVSGRKLSEKDHRAIQEGVYLCTNCNRCTVVCPVGINLKDLWLSVRERLIQMGHPEYSVLTPFSFYRGLMKNALPKYDYERPLALTRKAIASEYNLVSMYDRTVPFTPSKGDLADDITSSDLAKTFSVCFGCENCTTVCPVVGNYDNPREVLDLLPHQIMHSLGLRLRDLALGSRMLWDCLTCYQCQESCPQGVCVTDVFYALKNLAVRHMKEKRLS